MPYLSFNSTVLKVRHTDALMFSKRKYRVLKRFEIYLKRVNLFNTGDPYLRNYLLF